MCSLPFFCPQHELTIAEACGAEQPLGIALASKPLEVIAESSGARLLAVGWGSGDAQKERLEGTGSWCQHQDSPAGLVQ